MKKCRYGIPFHTVPLPALVRLRRRGSSSADIRRQCRVQFQGDRDNTNASNNYRPYETTGVGQYDWQNVQGFDSKLTSRRGALQRTVDHLDSYDLDPYHLSVSSWPLLWYQRMQQKRQVDSHETNDAKRRRTTGHEVVSSWYNHDALPAVGTQRANPAAPAADAVAMDTGDETSTKLPRRHRQRHRRRHYGVTSHSTAATGHTGAVDLRRCTT